MTRTSVIKILHGGAVAACVALLLGWAALPGYAQFSCTPSSSVSLWTGFGTGDWNVAGNWLPTGVPNSFGTSACILNGTAVAPTTVDVGANAIDDVDNLTLNKNNTLSISRSGLLSVFGPTTSNAGTIAVAGSLVLRCTS